MTYPTLTVQSTIPVGIEHVVEHSEVEQDYQYQPEPLPKVKILDLDIAKEFITALTGSPNTPMNFRTFAEAEDSESYAKKPKGSVLALATELQRLNNDGAGVFFTVQQATGDTAKDVTAIRALFVDFDGHLPTGLDFHLKPSIIVSTSGGGGHAYWVLSEPVAMSGEQLTQLHDRLVAHYWEPFRSDFKATDIARVMRLPGSYHLKEEPTLVTNSYIGSERYSADEVMRGISIDPRFVLDMKALDEAENKAKRGGKVKGASTRNSKPSTTPSLPSGKNNKDFDRMLTFWYSKVANCGEGGRNTMLFDAANTLAGLDGTKEGIIRSTLSEAAITCGLSLSEIETTLNSGITKGLGKPIKFYGSAGGGGQPNILTLDESIKTMSGTVRFNQMTENVEVDGVELDGDMLRRFTIQKFGYVLTTEDCRQCWIGAGKENPYHPVVEYLRGLPSSTPTLDLLSLASTLLGNDTPLAAVQLKKKLIASVARVMDPGCKQDEMFVLSGGQGLGKTTFIQALASKPWFTNDLTDIGDKDHVQLNTRKWLIEMAELDGVMSKKEDAILKAFISKDTDTYRAAYRHDPVHAKRTSSIFATTNKTEILQDPTGSRRYWIVEVKQAIDIAKVKELRDSIWYSALQAYDAGEMFHLTHDEDEARKEAAKQFTDVDPWVACLRMDDLVDNRKAGGYITSYLRLYDQLQIHIATRTKATDRRLAQILTQMGFEFKRIKEDGKAVKVWWVADKTW